MDEPRQHDLSLDTLRATAEFLGLQHDSARLAELALALAQQRRDLATLWAADVAGHEPAIELSLAEYEEWMPE